MVERPRPVAREKWQRKGTSKVYRILVVTAGLVVFQHGTCPVGYLHPNDFIHQFEGVEPASENAKPAGGLS